MGHGGAASHSVSAWGFGTGWLTDGWGGGGQIGLTQPQFKHSGVTLKGYFNVNSIWDHRTFAGGDVRALYLMYRPERMKATSICSISDLLSRISL